MGKSRQLAVAACAIAVVGVGAGAATAGEVTGNGKPLWTNTADPTVPHTLHGNSECAFSGQEDDQFFGGPRAGEHSQSWGQGVRNTQPVGGFGGFNPGLFCNPTKSSGEPGGA
jgi:hypothetical protein